MSSSTVIICFLSMLLYSCHIANSPGTSGSIYDYNLKKTKNTVYKDVMDVYKKNPEYRLPDSLNFLRIHYINSEKSVVSKLNSDSSNFHFFFREQNIVLWTAFVNRNMYWEKAPSTLSLVAYYDLNLPKKESESNWFYYKNINKKKRQEIMQLFESKILSMLPD